MTYNLTEDLFTTFLERCNLRDNFFISVMGSGGKTSFIKFLSGCFSNLGKSVLITTTTKIQSPHFFDWTADFITTDFNALMTLANIKSEFGIKNNSGIKSDSQIKCESHNNKFSDINKFINNVNQFSLSKNFNKNGMVVLYALESENEEKWRSPDLKDLNELKKVFDIILCEADGARKRPLKIHTERDPVIPSFSDLTVSIMGAWALGMKVRDGIFGYEGIFNGDELLDERIVQYCIDSPNGLTKNLKESDIIFINGINNDNFSYYNRSFSYKKIREYKNILLGNINTNYGVWHA